jgi:formate hydrogenlyase subunit 3/multisubunit Na+/H+ antiporter MnhD subunit
LTIVLNTFVSLKLAGENNFLWKYEFKIFREYNLLKEIKVFGNYYEIFYLVIIISLVGQAFLFMSLFIKNRKDLLIKIGVFTLWLGLFLLVFKADLAVNIFLMLNASLFIISSVYLIYRTKNKFDIVH